MCRRSRSAGRLRRLTPGRRADCSRIRRAGTVRRRCCFWQRPRRGDRWSRRSTGSPARFVDSRGEPWKMRGPGTPQKCERQNARNDPTRGCSLPHLGQEASTAVEGLTIQCLDTAEIACKRNRFARDLRASRAVLSSLHRQVQLRQADEWRVSGPAVPVRRDLSLLIERFAGLKACATSKSCRTARGTNCSTDCGAAL